MSGNQFTAAKAKGKGIEWRGLELCLQSVNVQSLPAPRATVGAAPYGLAACVGGRVERLDEESERAQELCIGPRVQGLALSFGSCPRVTWGKTATAHTPWQHSKQKACPWACQQTRKALRKSNPTGRKAEPKSTRCHSTRTCDLLHLDLKKNNLLFQVGA